MNDNSNNLFLLKMPIVKPGYNMPNHKLHISKHRIVISKDKAITSKRENLIEKHKNRLYSKSHGICLRPSIFEYKLQTYDYYINLYPEIREFITGLYNNYMSCYNIDNKEDLLIYEIYHKITQNPNINCIHIKYENTIKMKTRFKSSGLYGGGDDIIYEHNDTPKQTTDNIAKLINDIRTKN